MTKKTQEMPLVQYGCWQDGVYYDMEPSQEDIKAALDSNELEERNFQDDSELLRMEWERGSNGSIAEFYRLQKIYHIRRIAYFVVNDWTHPITLNADGTMHDGTHRLKAAIYLQKEEVEVRVNKVQSN